MACPLLFVESRAAAAPGPAPAPAPAPAPSIARPPTRVAIANPSHIFEKMAETKALREKLEVRRKELAVQEQEKHNTIEALLKRKGETNPNHPSYNEILEAIDNAKAGLQVWGSTAKASIDRENKVMLKSLYEKIETAIGEVAQAKGIDLVITDGRQELTNVEEVPAEELRRALTARIILFSTKELDISDEVITLLDLKYAKTASAVVPPPVAPVPPLPAH